VPFQLDDEKSGVQGRGARPGVWGVPTYTYQSDEAKQLQRDAKRPSSFNQLESH
jgi:hypothetical protein